MLNLCVKPCPNVPVRNIKYVIGLCGNYVLCRFILQIGPIYDSVHKKKHFTKILSRIRYDSGVTCTKVVIQQVTVYPYSYAYWPKCTCFKIRRLTTANIHMG